MLRAVIFDFNGILVDDEPIHLDMFQKVLGEEGIGLAKDDYYARYLGMDDRGCFKTAYHENGRTLSEGALQDLVRRKAAYYEQAIRAGLNVFPGVKTLVPRLAASYPLAIASGALRKEIEAILQRIGLKDFFKVIVSTEDIREGKPSPEIFLRALERLNQNSQQAKSIQTSECLVIEDSTEGILGARRAGMKCLAVANSHPAAKLAAADVVVKSLDETTVSFLEGLVR